MPGRASTPPCLPMAKQAQERASLWLDMDQIKVQIYILKHKIVKNRSLLVYYVKVQVEHNQIIVLKGYV